MVGDQAQIPVVLAPRDFVDPDVDEPLQPVGVEGVGADAFTHRPHSAPGDSGEQ